MKVVASIIMPCFNSEKHISKAISSVLKQSLKEFELLICDDGSSDGSYKIINQYQNQDQRIKCFRNKTSTGAANARNICLKNAVGQYICFLDSDDVWHDDRIEKHIDYMKKNNVLFSYSYNCIIDEDGVYKNIYYAPDQVDRNNMRFANFISCSTAIYDSHALGKIYQPNIKKRNDYALWLTILNHSKKPIGICYKKVTSSYRVNTYGLSSSKKDAALYFYKCSIEYNKQPKISAMFFLCLYLIIALIKKTKPDLYNRLVTKIF